jgi:endonuclease/exonuclease/phosphatase family metal-dependent hydrolase
MTYNIRAGRNTPGGLEAVAGVIAGRHPDIVGLQEVDRHWERSGRVDQADWLGARLGLHAVHGPALQPQPGAAYGVALLARWPVVQHETRALHDPHTPGSEPRAVLLARIASPAPLAVAVTHLEFASAAARLVQAAQVRDWARAWAGDDPLVVLGDFNAFPDASEIALLRAAFADACADRPAAQRVTFPGAPGDTRRGCLDYVFLGAGWQVRDCGVVEDAGNASDHQPVVASLVFSS